MYAVRVERDSVTPKGRRATSFVITFPRVCLAEVVTHRLNHDTWGYEAAYCERTTNVDISKNSASSRAIPIQKMIDKVMADPYMPVWTLQEKGMQGSNLTDETIIKTANNEWLFARNNMIAHASMLFALGVHKQDCNRLLEPWQWVTQIVTSSQWDNFFALRCHKAAFPPFRRVARMMYLARRKSTPVTLDYGQWHLPFVPLDEQMKLVHHVGPALRVDEHEFPIEIKRSAARCAWISYENHDRLSTDEAVLNTYSRLFSEIPKHASPIEHQLTPFHPAAEAKRPELRSNIKGWVQARKLVHMERVDHYEPAEAELATWDDVDVNA